MLQCLISTDVATLRIQQRRLLSQSALHGFAKGAVAIGSESYTPCACHVGAVVGKRTDKGYLAFFAQGQHATLILQQHKGLGCYAPCLGTVLVGEYILCPALLVTILIRVVEEPELVFCFEHTAACLVYLLHRHPTRLQVLLKGIDKSLRTHIHVGTGMEGLCRRIGKIGTDTMVEHLTNGAVVGDHKVVVTPLLA